MSSSCPECAQGKHGNCTGEVLHPVTDRLVACPCSDQSHRA